MSKKQLIKVIIASFCTMIPLYLFLYDSFFEKEQVEIILPEMNTKQITSISDYKKEEPIKLEEKRCPYSNTVYSRYSSEFNGYKKISYIIEIDTTFSKKELDAIADFYAQRESCKRVFIEFYLSSQDKNGMNYAISKRLPDESTTVINYVAIPKIIEPQSEQKDTAPYHGCKIFGKWDLGIGGFIVIYQKEGECYMCNVFGNTHYDDPELFYKTTYRGHIAFKNSDDENDMYVIEGNSLVGYYEYERAAVFSKIK